MRILIQNNQRITAQLRRIQSVARRLLRAEGQAEDTEVSILLTDDAYIAQLNSQYRHVEGPTDVLSFSQTEGDDEPIPGMEDNVLGDVVISVETAQRQAAEQANSLESEMDMLLVHGLLHLLGYDHAEPDEERVMFARQDEFLKGLDA